MKRQNQIEEYFPMDLTYEQFKAHACRKPSLEGEWIYKLEHTKVDYDDDEDDEGEASGTRAEKCDRKSEARPVVGSWSTEYFFLTFEQAESFISTLVNEESVKETFRYIIYQIPTGMFCREQGVAWLYDRFGKLIDYTNTTEEVDDPMSDAFCGRTPDRMRFKPGEIVEVCSHNRVYLAVVCIEAPTVDFCWGIYQRSKKNKRGYICDAGDDQYVVLTGPGYGFHHHIWALNLMKPHREIPEDVRDFLMYCYEKRELDIFEKRFKCFTYPQDQDLKKNDKWWYEPDWATFGKHDFGTGAMIDVACIPCLIDIPEEDLDFPSPYITAEKDGKIAFIFVDEDPALFSLSTDKGESLRLYYEDMQIWQPVKDWIILNLETLRAYWKCEFDTVELITRLLNLDKTHLDCAEEIKKKFNL